MKFRTLIGDESIRQEQRSLGKNIWPEYMQHDLIVEHYWSNLYKDFLDFQFAVYSEDEIAGVGNLIPIHWVDDIDNLPARGLDWAMEKAANDVEEGFSPNVLVGVQILINPALQSKGLSYEFLNQMKQIGRTKEFNQIVFPVRPTRKHIYPLIPMEEYIEWTNHKGEPFDPWIRVHLKAGGKIVSICSESMVIKGTIDDWQDWTGLNFQSSGLYTIEKALCPINIDLNTNTGSYIEPNVWIIHST